MAGSPTHSQSLNNHFPAPGGWKNTACFLVSMETKQQKEDLEAWVQDLTGFKSQLPHLQAVGLQFGNSLKFCEPSFLICKTNIRKEQNWVWKTHFVPQQGRGSSSRSAQVPWQISGQRGYLARLLQNKKKRRERGGRSRGDSSGNSEFREPIQGMQ